MNARQRVLAATLMALTLAAPPTRAADTMPPEIAAIMQRMKSGTPPSPEDQQKLQAWAQSMMPPGSPPIDFGSSPDGPNPNGPTANGPTPDGPTIITAGDRPGGEACPAPGHAVTLPGPVDEAAYLLMAVDTARAYGTQVPREGRDAIETTLADTIHPVAGADIAAALVLRGYGSAAAIAAARGAVANPSDPNTANTLGTVLRGMQDYRRATIAFAYAAVLTPGSATLANNRAWLAFSQGDFDAAGTLFDTAAYAGAPQPTVFLGKAMIFECAGQHARALPLFRASLAMQWSDMAADGIQFATQSIQKADGPGADIGSPDAYGDKDKSGQTPYWPDPPLAPTAQEFAAHMRGQHETWPIAIYAKGWQASVETNIRTITANRTRLSETIIDGNSTTINFGYDRQIFILDDIFEMIQARDYAKYDKFTQQTENALQDDGVISIGPDPSLDKMSCGMVRARNTKVHGGYMPNAEGRWTEVRQAMNDLYAFSSSTLASIDDGATNAAAGALLAERAVLMAEAFTTSLHMWAQETNAAWRFKDFDCLPPPPKPRPVGSLKPYKHDPLACKAGELHENYVVVGLNADCTHMVLSLGELLQGSLDYKFGKDWDHDTLTIWAGAGFGTNGGNTRGSVTAGASSGVYATVGAGGALIDAGYSGQGGVTVGAPNMKAMPGGNMEPGPPPPDIQSGQGGASLTGTVGARISLIDGPPNPITGQSAVAGEGEITTGHGITFGANGTGSMTSGRAMHVPP